MLKDQDKIKYFLITSVILFLFIYYSSGKRMEDLSIIRDYPIYVPAKTGIQVYTVRGEVISVPWDGIVLQLSEDNSTDIVNNQVFKPSSQKDFTARISRPVKIYFNEGTDFVLRVEEGSELLKFSDQDDDITTAQRFSLFDIGHKSIFRGDKIEVKYENYDAYFSGKPAFRITKLMSGEK